MIKGIGKEVLPVTVAANAQCFWISNTTQFFMDKKNNAAPLQQASAHPVHRDNKHASAANMRSYAIAALEGLLMLVLLANFRITGQASALNGNSVYR